MTTEAIDPSDMIHGGIEINEDTCSICRRDMEEHNVYIVPECSHKFHADCVVPWFRTGNNTCPLCRSVPFRERYYGAELNGRYKFNRKFAQRKNAPRDLKKMVERIQRLEKNQTQRVRDLKEWCQSADGRKWKDLNKVYKKLRTRAWQRRWGPDSISALKTEIASYPIIAVPVPERITKRKT